MPPPVMAHRVRARLSPPPASPRRRRAQAPVMEQQTPRRLPEKPPAPPGMFRAQQIDALPARVRPRPSVVRLLPVRPCGEVRPHVLPVAQVPAARSAVRVAPASSVRLRPSARPRPSSRAGCHLRSSIARRGPPRRARQRLTSRGPQANVQIAARLPAPRYGRPAIPLSERLGNVSRGVARTAGSAGCVSIRALASSAVATTPSSAVSMTTTPSVAKQSRPSASSSRPGFRLESIPSSTATKDLYHRSNA